MLSCILTLTFIVISRHLYSRKHRDLWRIDSANLHEDTGCRNRIWRYIHSSHPTRILSIVFLCYFILTLPRKWRIVNSHLLQKAILMVIFGPLWSVSPAMLQLKYLCTSYQQGWNKGEKWCLGCQFFLCQWKQVRFQQKHNHGLRLLTLDGFLGPLGKPRHTWQCPLYLCGSGSNVQV